MGGASFRDGAAARGLGAATHASSAVLLLGSPGLRPGSGAAVHDPVPQPCPCCCPLHLGSGLPQGTHQQASLLLSPQALHSLGLRLLSALHALRPWHYALKRIGGQFGSSVLSYFLFLKTLLAFNALLLLPLLAFIAGPQAAFPPARPGPAPAFTGLELLLGGVRAGPGARARRGHPPVPASPGRPHPCPAL